MNDQKDDTQSLTVLSRRAFLKGGLLTTAAASTGQLLIEPALRAGAGAKAATLGPGAVPVTLRVNGKLHRLSVEPRVTLATALREYLGLTGTKVVCDRGECGGCTVLRNGDPIYSCMTLAIEAQGYGITTIEGVAQGNTLHPIQEAFVKHDALMCGFCTPGFIMAIKGFLDTHANPTLDEVRLAVSGNICRCGTYPRIFEAALDAAKKMRR
jgi:aerobic-type carbon monoxide dehydrogenase small subunit (CoxS/CutS family)